VCVEGGGGEEEGATTSTTKVVVMVRRAKRGRRGRGRGAGAGRTRRLGGGAEDNILGKHLSLGARSSQDRTIRSASAQRNLTHG